MYKLAVEQSNQPEPLNGLSVLTFQDSIELFLQLSCESLNIAINPKKEPAFMEYFDLIKGKILTELAERDSIHRLNKARVAFKHHGNLPSMLDIESFRVSATNFFVENIPKIFEIELYEISIIHLIEFPKTKENLLTAKEKIAEDNYEDSAKSISIAFQELIYEYWGKNSDSLGLSLYDFEYGRELKNVTFLDDDLYSTNEVDRRNMKRMKEIEALFQKSGDQFDTIGEILKIIVLNSDYKKYLKFKSFLPETNKCIGGEYHFGFQRKLPTKCDLQYCIDFVIECALKLQKN
jgi:hypothetical protein